MNHFVVGQHQDEILTGGVGHAEGHLVVVKFAEIRVQFHVFQEIVHPDHVPFEFETKAAVFRSAGNHRPCGGFLCDHCRTVALFVYHAV